MRLIRQTGHFIGRTLLALRYWIYLNYSWRLAWIKTERN